MTEEPALGWKRLNRFHNLTSTVINLAVVWPHLWKKKKTWAQTVDTCKKRVVYHREVWTLISRTNTLKWCLSHLHFFAPLYSIGNIFDIFMAPKSYRAGIQKWFINNLQTFCHLYRLIHFIKRCAQWANPVVWRRKVRAAPCNKAGEMSHQQKWGLEMKNARTAPRQNLWFGEADALLHNRGDPLRSPYPRVVSASLFSEP